MASFFRSPGQLAKWMKDRGSPLRAAEAVGNLPGIDRKYANDIRECSERIFNGQDADTAGDTLFRILAKAGITDVSEDQADAVATKEDKVVAADSLLRNKAITASEHAAMVKEAGIEQYPEKFVMPLRACPKLPVQSGGQRLISTFNCRHHCLDSLVLDDEPDRVYCLELLWRKHVAHKFSREWQDRKTGKWVGGYINDRFYVFEDAGTPGNPDAPRDGGNPMGLPLGVKSRQPRPHEWSYERRLQEQREKGSTKSITLAGSRPAAFDIFKTASSTQIVKLSASDSDSVSGKAEQAFRMAVDMKEEGVPDGDSALRISKELGMPLGSAVRIQAAATALMARHGSDVYEAEGGEKVGLVEAARKIQDPAAAKEQNPSGMSDLDVDARASGLLEDMEAPAKKPAKRPCPSRNCPV